MPPVTGKKTLSPKKATAVSSFICSVTFDTDEFTVSTGYGTIEGPFSLEIAVAPGDVSPLYVGIQINTIDGQITVSDRKHIAYIPDSNITYVISANTVPSLANIYGVVTGITLTFYSFIPMATSANFPTVALRIDEPRSIVSVPPFIGADMAVYVPSFYENASFVGNVGAGASTVICTLTVASGFRLRLRNAHLSVGPVAAAAGDSAALLEIVDLELTTRIITRCPSQTVQFAVLDYSEPIELYGSCVVRIRAATGAGNPLFVCDLVCETLL